MSYNLFVAYDLMTPGQNYDALQKQIKSLGQWHQLQFSLFYVHTSSSPEAAYSHIRLAMDANDRLAVISFDRAMVSNSKPEIDAINSVWYSQAA